VHYRAHLNGPAASVDAAAAELVTMGAHRIEGPGPSCVTIAGDRGLDEWVALSLRHRGVSFGLECFESFQDELLLTVIADGESTEMSRRSVLPDDWGSCHDEDGEPLADGVLRAAAEAIAERRLQRDGVSCRGTLEVALHVASALGRFGRAVEATAFSDEPSRGAVDAVVDLAALALDLSAPGAPECSGWLDFDRALRLTQSQVHAGRSEYRDQPGSACWGEWLQILLGSASGVIDLACEAWPGAGTDARALGTEHYGAPAERAEFATRSLLTTCVEALALFYDLECV
jgi:hypothetical protein